MNFILTAIQFIGKNWKIFGGIAALLFIFLWGLKTGMSISEADCNAYKEAQKQAFQEKKEELEEEGRKKSLKLQNDNKALSYRLAKQQKEFTNEVSRSFSGCVATPELVRLHQTIAIPVVN